MQDDRLHTAFELLRSIVGEMYDADRRTYTASVKPHLLDQTAGGFSERDLGFKSFRAFIEAAEQTGAVQTFPAPVGPDVEIVPVGKPSKEAERQHGRERGPDGVRRVRRPVWEAFMDWTPNQLRVFDRETGRIHRIPREAVILEPAENGRLRRAFVDDPERYVEIPMIHQAEQEQWMHDYVAVAPKTPAIGAVELALSSPTPFRAFAHAVQIEEQQKHSWREYRLHRVTAHISKWEAEHGVSVDALEAAADRPEATEHSQPAADETVQRVRAAVHAAIDRMPLEALNRLQVPVEYLVES